MMALLRAIGAIVAAMVVGFALIVAVEMFSNVVHPFPADFRGTQEEMCAHVERYPAWVLAVAAVAWAATALASTWVAGRLGNRLCALVVGLLLVAALVTNLSMLPYPIWFKVGCLVAIPAGCFLGDSLSRRRSGSGLGSVASG